MTQDINNTGTLPVVDPAAEQADEAVENCCCYLAVRHSTREAGEGRRWTWKAMHATRFVASLSLLILGSLHASNVLPFLRSLDHQYLILAIFLVGGTSFSSLGACTTLAVQGTERVKFSSTIVAIHGIVSSFFWLPLVLIVQAAIYLGFFPALELFAALPLLFFLGDVLVLHAKIRLRYRYAVMALVIYGIYAAVARVHGFGVCSYCEPPTHAGVIARIEIIRAAVMVLGAILNVSLTRYGIAF